MTPQIRGAVIGVVAAGVYGKLALALQHRLHSPWLRSQEATAHLGTDQHLTDVFVVAEVVDLECHLTSPVDRQAAS